MHKTNGSQQGFSLIELMVVVSIISLLSVLAIPKFFAFKIRAARTEMYTNLRFVKTTADSHYAENQTAFFGTYGTTALSGVVTNSCTTTSIGVSMTNCNDLRYFYNYSMTSAGVFSGDAISAYYLDAGSVLFRAGNRNGPHTRQCVSLDGFQVAYYDRWVYTGDVGPAPYSNDPTTFSADKNCMGGVIF